ncbi:MAG: hypothetical protein VB092_05270 [Oscillospiraceae bacterium]|nr:hypothetical protein [Oscillospiraceae bacterium]
MLEEGTTTGEIQTDPAAQSSSAAEQTAAAPKKKRARKKPVDSAPETAAGEATAEDGSAAEQAAAPKPKHIWKKPAGSETAAGETTAEPKAAEQNAADGQPPAKPKRPRRGKGAPQAAENSDEARATASTGTQSAAETAQTETTAEEGEAQAEEISALAAAATAVAEKPEETAPVKSADTENTQAAAQPALTETEKPLKRRVFARPHLLIVLAVIFGLLCCGAYCFANGAQPFTLASLASDGVFADDGTVAVTAQLGENLFKSGEAWYCVTQNAEAPAADDACWLAMEGGVCTFSVPAGSYYLHIRDKSGRLTEDDASRAVACAVLAVRVDPQKEYFAVEGRKEFTAETVAFGGADTALTWSVADDAIAVVTNGRLVATAVGETTLTAAAQSGACGTAQIVVTDLITLPDMDTYGKPMLSAGLYTEEEGALIDEILFARVAEAGDSTRGGVLAAARFISLEFPYRVPYFFENGRLNPAWEGRPYADGEGRYYHKGMYLTESKYAGLDPDGIRWGPAYWGQDLRNWETKYHFVSGYLYPNGFDCSGFVSWVLLNGGFDYGDVGAGMDAGIFDLSDIGDQRRITTELLQSDIINAGDLIYCDGHMAIIIGISEEKIYVAEALFTSVRVTSFDRVYSAVPHALYTHIALMGEEYAQNGNGDGVFTQMWDQYDSVQETERYWNYNWR